VALACTACHAPASASSVAERPCGLTIWYSPASDASQVTAIGSWDGWSTPGTSMPATRSDGWRVVTLALAPGEYTYQIDDEGQMLANPNVGPTAMQGGVNGTEVTWTLVPSCDVPLVSVTTSSGSADGSATIAAEFLASRFGDPVDPNSITAVDHDGTALPASAFQVDPGSGTVAIATTGLAAGKHTITLGASDTKGRPADQAIATVWIEPQPFDLQDTVIYEVMVDRYASAQGPLAPPSSMGGRAGGTVDGVRAAVESGQIEALGVNTIWLSPLQTNPDGEFLGLDDRFYTGYHGYWPSAPRSAEGLQAPDASLDALISAAHARGIRVLFDVVPHHVHQQHPYFAEHLQDGWFLHPDGTCVCGTTCSWATDELDCAFAPYLPTLDWTNPAVADQITSDIVWWQSRYDADGIRIDAVPMMPRSATRRIVAGVRGQFDNPGHASFLLGENFTSDFDSLRYELGPYGLDSEFHFPLMWELQSVVGQGAGAMSDLDATVQAGLTAWAGSGAVMSLILDNHDVARFSTVSAGDDDGDTWVPAPQPTDPTVYARQALALAMIYTLPGAPTLYYGDEIALAGKSDPDSRRVMPAESQLTSLEISTRATARALGAAHTCELALRRGTYRLLYADQETWAFARELTGSAEPVIVVATRNPSGTTTIPMPGIPAGAFVDLLSGHQASLQPELTNPAVAPFSVALYVPAGGSCAHLAPQAP
jgi:glycosidase